MKLSSLVAFHLTEDVYNRLVKFISAVTLLETIHHISVAGILINAKNKRHFQLLALTVQIWEVKSASIWGSSTQPVIQLRDTCWWKTAAINSIINIPLRCSASTESVFNLISEEYCSSRHELFICLYAEPAATSVRPCSNGVVGHIFTSSWRKKRLLITMNLSVAACFLQDCLWNEHNSTFHTACWL